MAFTMPGDIVELATVPVMRTFTRELTAGAHIGAAGMMGFGAGVAMDPRKATPRELWMRETRLQLFLSELARASSKRISPTFTSSRVLRCEGPQEDTARTTQA